MVKGTQAVLVLALLACVAWISFYWWQGTSTTTEPDAPPHSGAAGETSAELPPAAMTAASAKTAELAAAPGNERTAIDRPEGAAKPSEPVPVIRLTGRLVTPMGKPVSGQQVRYRPAFEEGLPLPIEFDPRGDRTPAKDLPRTNADGVFVLEAYKGRPGLLQLPEQQWVFREATESTIPGTSTFRFDPVESERDLGPIQVVAAAQITGTIRDLTGKPLEGIGIRIQNAASPSVLPLFFGNQGPKSDAQGKFALRGLPAGKFRLTTSSAGHVTTTRELELREAEHKADVVFELAQGRTIAGSVLDDLGRAVPGASVVARKKSLSGTIVIEGVGEVAAKTDAQGRFVLGGVDETGTTVRAGLRGYESAQQVDVPAGTANLVLALTRQGSVSGVLVDNNGQPIVGSEVSYQRPSSEGESLRLPGFGVNKTDKDGRFHLENVTPGVVTVRAEGDEHRPTDPVRVSVQPGTLTSDVKLVGRRGALVDVLVVDAKGDPVEGALVEVKEPAPVAEQQIEGPTQGARMRRVERRMRANGDFQVNRSDAVRVLGERKTGKDGRARIGGLPAGAAFVHASHPDLAGPKPAPVTLADSGAAEVRLAMRRGGSLELTVIDVDKRPIAKARVRIKGPIGPGEEVDTRTVTTNADGQVKVGPLAPGTYSAVLAPEGKPMNVGGMAMVLMGEPEPLEESRIELAVREDQSVLGTMVQPLLATLNGTIQDATGPVANAQIELTRIREESNVPGLPSGSHSGKSGKDGRFAVDGLPAGKYTLSYGKRDALVMHEETFEVPAGQRQIEKNLVLHGSTVRIKVVSDPDAAPVHKAKVEIERVASGSGQRTQRRAVFAIAMTNNDTNDNTMQITSGNSSVMTDEEGVAVLEGLPLGKYRVQVEHNRYAPHKTEPFDLGLDATHDLGTAKLVAGGALAGSVRVPESAGGMIFAMVEIKPVGGKPDDVRRVPAAGGSFKQNGLAPGKYAVRAQNPEMGGGNGQDSWGQEQIVEVKPGETARVKLELPVK